MSLASEQQLLQDALKGKQKGNTMAYKDMTITELVKLYNKHSKKKVKTFRDKTIAVERVKAVVHASKVRKPETKRKQTETQFIRHKVKVHGELYGSVAKAFTALKLPMGQHIKFRMELKAAGAKTFDGHKFTLVQT